MSVGGRFSRAIVIATAAAVLMGMSSFTAAAPKQRCAPRRAHNRVGEWTAARLPRTPVPPASVRDVAEEALDGISEVSLTEPGNRIHSYAVDPTDPDTVYVADEWRVLVSIDGGCRWAESYSVLDEPLPTGEERHIVSLESGRTRAGEVRVYALLRRGLADGQSGCCLLEASVAELATLNESGTWEIRPVVDGDAPVPGVALALKVAPNDPDVAYLVNAAVEQGPFPGSHALYASADGGVTWELRARSVRSGPWTNGLGDLSCAGGAERCTGIDFRHMAIDPLEPEVLWSANDDGIFQSTDGGHSWTNRQAITWRTLGSVQAIDVHRARRIAVFGEFKTAWSEDGGRTWALHAPPGLRAFDGAPYAAPISSMANGRTSDELVALHAFPERAAQVLVKRRTSWLQTFPALLDRPDEDSPFRDLLDATYVRAGDAYFFLTADGGHLVTLELRR